jgi:hypothetical protein
MTTQDKKNKKGCQPDKKINIKVRNKSPKSDKISVFVLGKN